MEHYQDSGSGLSFRQPKNPLIVEALENSLIFTALLIAVSAALYILNGQITALL